MDWPALLSTLVAGSDLSATEASGAIGQILAGEATDAQIGAFLVALRMKGESITEVSAMVDAMLDAAAPITLPPGADAIDIVGTGGAPSRRLHALNVSTMASFVAAGAGARVVKHGNRKASSTSGSFDLLEQLGVPLELDGPGVAHCIAEAGIAFCFARSFHPAMRHAGPVRTQLGIPTVFNFLGPLSHPARVQRQVIGVSDERIAPIVVGVLKERGSPRALVVTGHDGMDEFTTTTTSTVHELRDGVVTSSTFDPRDVGIQLVAVDAIAGGGPEVNAEIAGRIFSGETSAYSDIVCLNAAAGLFVAGLVDDIGTGVIRARESLASGAAAGALERLVSAANDATN